MLDLSGKNVCFVAGLGGIGLEACKCFLKKKVANLYILDTMESNEALKQLKTDFPKTNILFSKLDVTKKTEIERVIKEVVNKMAYIDILVNGAGVIADKNVELTMAVNLIGLINTTLIAIPYMDKSLGGRGGMIVNIASVLGLEPSPGIAVYSASKHGVIGFTRSLADDFYYQRTGIKHIAVCPGITKTPMVHNLLGKETFDYSRELASYLTTCKAQEHDVMGASLVKSVEMGKNGGMYICDLGTVKEVDPKLYWQMKF